MKCLKIGCTYAAHRDGPFIVCIVGHRNIMPAYAHLLPADPTAGARDRDGDPRYAPEYHKRTRKEPPNKCKGCGKPCFGTRCPACFGLSRRTGGKYAEGKKCACGKPIKTRKAQECKCCAGKKNGRQGKELSMAVLTV